eukprot:13787957-Ditylum_brightwellii.AAC.1
MKSSTATPSAGTPNQNLVRNPLISGKESPPKKIGKTMTINKHKLKITFKVGLQEDIKPCKKFAPLLFLLVQRSPSLTLEEWGSTERDCSQ